MDYSKRFSQRRNRRKNRKGTTRNIGYVPNIPRSLALSAGPTRYAPLNDTFTVSLKNQDYFGGATELTQELFQVLGLVEFLSYRPLYAIELYSMYKYARVTRVDVRAECVNLGSVAVQFGVGHIAYNDASGLTFDRFIEKPGTTKKLLSPKGGMDRGVITKSFNSTQLLGSVLDSKYWVDITQSASTTPIDVREPVLVLGMDNYQSSSTPYAAQVNFTLTYHVQFFDLKTPSSS